jgi:putative DNA primase/helicase
MNDEDSLAPIIELCDEDEMCSPETTMAETDLPSLNHADLAKDFLASERGKDFYHVYDLGENQIASWTGTRWVISDSTKQLRSAVRDYLDRLYVSLPQPKKGHDYRAKLKSGPFCREVAAEATIKLPPIKKETFDRDHYLLGLPNGAVAELRTGNVRTMQREDFISNRLYIAPDAEMPTPRWTRFVSEIAVRNAELEGFLLRLCALCLTAHPFQGLFFFWGKGRNGKGVLLRLLSHILGHSFVAVFRPGEVTVSKFDEDRAKRSLSKLEDARLAMVDESVGGNLNLPLLKLMSGGDRIAAAKMRQDDRTFMPTHKLILPTNERPELPNSAAFGGRLFFVPFLADYSDRSKQDAELEITLAREAPGILARLIQQCPDVITNGLQEPEMVKAASRAVLEENDRAKQFQEDMLADVPGSNVTGEEMRTAIYQWLNGSTGGQIRSIRIEAQVDEILTELKAKFQDRYKRLRPEGRTGRRIYYFLDVAVREEKE